MSTVFITGAQANTGYGIAEFFAKQGWDVILTSLWKDQAEAAAKKLSETYGVFSKGYECNIRKSGAQSSVPENQTLPQRWLHCSFRRFP